MAGVARILGPVGAVVVLVVLAVPAEASDNAPSFVVPGRVDVPVYIDGRESSWSVVENDWGLYRAGWMPPTVIHPLCCVPPRPTPRRFQHWFPASAEMPGYGRLERDPDAGQPTRGAPSFHESWEAKSAPNPATIMPPNYDMPGMLIAPADRYRGWRPGGGRP